jgi:flagellar biosynthetic protein FliR
MVGFSEAQIMAWLSPILWPFIRILAIFTASPVLSSRSVPMRVKVGLAFLVAVSVQAALPNMPVISLNSPELFGVVLQQVGVGLAIGFAVRVVFSAFEFAGELIGTLMGLNFAAFFDPTLNTQATATSRIYIYMASLLFVVLNGHIMLMMAVVRSFEAFPVDQNFIRVLEVVQLYKLGGELFASALWIALPVIGMLMFTNLAMGIVARVAPQMNIFTIGFPLTLIVGMLGMVATLPMLDRPYMAMMQRAVELFSAR